MSSRLTVIGVRGDKLIVSLGPTKQAVAIVPPGAATVDDVRITRRDSALARGYVTEPTAGTQAPDIPGLAEKLEVAEEAGSLDWLFGAKE